MSKEIMQEKAVDTSFVYDDLLKRLDLKDLKRPTLIVDDAREKEFKSGYLKNNPFPGVTLFVLASLRKKCMNKLFLEENVLQTPAIAATLSLCSALASNILSLRTKTKDNSEIYTDLAYSGMQAIRLYVSDNKGKEFKKKRYESAIRVDNAFNGSFYKYKTKDNRYFSFHVYYQSQQEKLVEALKLNKASKDFKFLSTKKDRRYLASVVKTYNSLDLENLVFDSGACGCVLRTRDEWEATSVGKAVKKMPLIRFTEEGEKSDISSWGNVTTKGPLSGIKVLDLTHIIAGPACSRILAEYGADVLLVRRGKFMDQEQALLELDGWVGKNSIQLDLNDVKDLMRMKELIKEADVITYSYQNGCFDKFGLSEREIRELNPHVIYSNLMCFSDSVWKERPGWAPCAEDITGLSVRNGSLESPKNLNGVPLDYFPGMLLALGTLIAIKRKIETGVSLHVTTSLTRGAEYLHEVTDLCLKNKGKPSTLKIINNTPKGIFNDIRTYVNTNSIGEVGFPNEGTYNTSIEDIKQNYPFEDGKKGF
jgi:Predicted acyl-CoA transferases/carnitine dehydratase